MKYILTANSDFPISVCQKNLSIIGFSVESIDVAKGLITGECEEHAISSIAKSRFVKSFRKYLALDAKPTAPASSPEAPVVHKVFMGVKPTGNP